MRKIIEDDSGEGLEALLGEQVLLLCANYFYTGRLVGVNDTCVKLEAASIVYETGEWASGAYKDVQQLPSPFWYVSRAAIESFGLSR